MDLQTFLDNLGTAIGITAAAVGFLGAGFKIWWDKRKTDAEVKKTQAQADAASSDAVLSDVSAARELIQSITFLMQVVEDTKTQVREDIVRGLTEIKDSIRDSRVMYIERLTLLEEGLSTLADRVAELERNRVAAKSSTQDPEVRDSFSSGFPE